MTTRPYEDEVTLCMDIISDWIAERHPLDARRMGLFKLPKEQGEGIGRSGLSIWKYQFSYDH